MALPSNQSPCRSADGPEATTTAGPSGCLLLPVAPSSVFNRCEDLTAQSTGTEDPTTNLSASSGQRPPSEPSSITQHDDGTALDQNLSQNPDNNEQQAASLDSGETAASTLEPELLAELLRAISSDQQVIDAMIFPRLPRLSANTDKGPVLLRVHQLKRNFPAVGLAVIATVTAIFTSMYCWEATLRSRALERILWKNPQSTIFTINLLSLITIELLGVLISTACDNFRWKLSKKGIGLLSFTALAGTTSWLGLFQLLFAKPPTMTNDGEIDSKWGLLGYRFLSLQR